ncbi:hypothetical protein DEO72_LG8g1585 [Vigna unguiculata]|uniref:Uncharacterized protein n=1 Tax=Vigna unguiculata TaxID=3917 RepID=A0A4D6MPT5_VIGUN|nr:hypothetical protein DEO72_LG8g1585 [Vigna unguiculata]
MARAMWDLLGVPEQAPQSRAMKVEGELSGLTVGAIVSILTQVRSAAIIRNKHHVPEVLSALERLSFVTVLSLKGTSKDGGRLLAHQVVYHQPKSLTTNHIFNILGTLVLMNSRMNSLQLREHDVTLIEDQLREANEAREVQMKCAGARSCVVYELRRMPLADRMSCSTILYIASRSASSEMVHGGVVRGS